MGLAELPPALLPWILGAWLLALGGAVGSFVNVVVYRLPLGKSLVFPGSHCPRCQHPIRWYDNVPVVAWFYLGGRCRDCAGPISPRYPAVEAFTALVFLAVGLRAALAAQPEGFWPWPDALSAAVAAAWVGALARAGFHLVLLCTLLAAALVEYDGHRVPVRLCLPALIVGLAAPLAWPALRPAPLLPGVDGWMTGTLGGLAGLLAGLLVAALFRPLLGPRHGHGLLVSGPCVGAYGAWQLGGTLVAVAGGAGLLLGLLARRWPPLVRVSPSACLLLAYLVWALH